MFELADNLAKVNIINFVRGVVETFFHGDKRRFRLKIRIASFLELRFHVAHAVSDAKARLLRSGFFVFQFGSWCSGREVLYI
jgi:hypothetical protein